MPNNFKGMNQKRSTRQTVRENHPQNQSPTPELLILGRTIVNSKNPSSGSPHRRKQFSAMKSASWKGSSSPSQKEAYSMSTPSQIRAALRSVSTTVTIVLGSEEVHRQVPRELLTTISPFFNAALTGSFAESETQTVTLPEDRADVFDYFLFWLYTRRLDHEAVDAVEPTKPAYFWLLHLYCLVDKFMVESCKNAIVEKITRLAEETNSVPTPTDTWIIFETFGSQDNNKMRRLVVDLFAWKRTDNLLDTHEDEWHPRFMRDLVVRMKRTDIKATEKPWVRNMCQHYHEHANTGRCS